MSRVVCISPHLDDAVFSVGAFLTACAAVTPVLIVTVCAGIPAEGIPAGGYDASRGFKTAAEAMRARRTEDHEAADFIGADVLHLPVVDDQYADRLVDRDEQILEALRPVLATAGKFLAPLGIRHPDHLAVARAMRGRAHLLYEEIPYRYLWPDAVPISTGALSTIDFSTCLAKQRAISCYRSQMDNDSPMWAFEERERIHRVRFSA